MRKVIAVSMTLVAGIVSGSVLADSVDPRRPVLQLADSVEPKRPPRQMADASLA
jgi:hypothetical protein